jgi:meiotically up-regulated gene 157 (Mug157) protein
MLPVPADVSNLLEKLRVEASEQTFTMASLAITSLFEKAMTRLEDGTIFVSTGDIPAMWIRDSTWQLRPLLAACNQSGETEEVIAAVSKRQAKYLLIDPYANAFNIEANGFCWHKDFEDQDPWVFERKFEIDSIAAFFDLALRLYRKTNYKNHLDETFWLAAEKCVALIQREMNHDPDSYIFVRENAPTHDYLSHEGKGAPFKNVGLVWSGFRPSDDACVLPFHIPANAHLLSVLGWLSEAAADFGRKEISELAIKLALEISDGIRNHGYIGDRMAYEVDGLGNAVDLDDPNVPSLLALPYLGWCSPEYFKYQNTREHILSREHKMFVRGLAVEGISSSHTPERNIWPLALAIQGLTTDDKNEQTYLLETLEAITAGTNHNHESVNVDDPTQYTRPWFSWADMTYFHLAIKVHGLSELAD